MKQHSTEFQEKLEGISFPPALPAKKYVSKYISRYIQTMREKNGNHIEQIHDQWEKIYSHGISSAILAHQQVLLTYCFVPEIKQEEKIHPLLLWLTENLELTQSLWDQKYLSVSDKYLKGVVWRWLEHLLRQLAGILANLNIENNPALI